MVAGCECFGRLFGGKAPPKQQPKKERQKTEREDAEPEDVSSVSWQVVRMRGVHLPYWYKELPISE